MDAAPVSDVAWVKFFVEIGSFALVAWLMYTTFSKNIPRMSAELKETVKQLSDDFKLELRESRIAHDKESQMRREEFRTQLQELQIQFRAELSENRKFQAQEAENMRKVADRMLTMLEKIYSKGGIPT